MNKHAWGAAALLILAGCGGGSDDSSSTASTPAAAAAQLRTAMSVQQARPAAAASAADAAEQLLDFAEAAFPAYFPVHQSTSTLDPFRFRHYPQTGVYVGVVVKPGMGYTMDGVYVMGGPFGEEPVYVGQISDLIPTTPPIDPSAAGDNGCFNLPAMATIGSRTVITLQHTGTRVGTTTMESTPQRRVSFEGHEAVAILERTTGSLTVGGVSYPQDNERTVFSQIRGTTELVLYGWELTATSTPLPGGTTTTITRGVATPPTIDRRAGLALGQSAVMEYHDRITTVTTTTITALPNIPPQVSTLDMGIVDVSSTTTFAARETLTVPAGTFDTCRFEDRTSTGQVITSWVMAGHGLPLKMRIEKDGQSEISEAVAIERQGVPQ
jgi:hypothetical protein